jgi:hypothetical protein
VLYIDTVVEPWLGFYFDKNMKNASRTNYALRETVRHEKRRIPAAPPRSPAAAPIPAWSPGSSSRRWSISPMITGHQVRGALRSMIARPGPS